MVIRGRRWEIKCDTYAVKESGVIKRYMGGYKGMVHKRFKERERVKRYVCG